MDSCSNPARSGRWWRPPSTPDGHRRWSTPVDIGDFRPCWEIWAPPSVDYVPVIRQWGELPPDAAFPATVLEASDGVSADDPSVGITELEFELPRTASPVLDELDSVRLRAVQDVL